MYMYMYLINDLPAIELQPLQCCQSGVGTFGSRETFSS